MTTQQVINCCMPSLCLQGSPLRMSEADALACRNLGLGCIYTIVSKARLASYVRSYRIIWNGKDYHGWEDFSYLPLEDFLPSLIQL